jgi:hypothetical protein
MSMKNSNNTIGNQTRDLPNLATHNSENVNTLIIYEVAYLMASKFIQNTMKTIPEENCQHKQ